MLGPIEAEHLRAEKLYITWPVSCLRAMLDWIRTHRDLLWALNFRQVVP